MTSSRHTLAAVSALAVVIALLSGCAHPKRWLSNTSTVREEIMSFPDGGNLYAQITQTTHASGAKERQRKLVWERPNQPPKRLQVRGGDDVLMEGVLDVQSHSAAFASADGKRVVVADGMMIMASFDYESGIAVLGDTEHPDWALELAAQHSAHPAATSQGATSWPGPLEERLLVGIWVKKLALEHAGQPYDVMELKADQTWRTARVWNDLDRPTKVEYVETGGRFELNWDDRFGATLVLRRPPQDGGHGIAVDSVSPDVLHSGWYQYRRWRGPSPIGAIATAASARVTSRTPAVTTAPTPDVQSVWPPALDERMLVGTWEQHFDDPGDPLDHYVLELNADHTWRQLIVRGDPHKPSAVTVRNAGQWWEIEPPNLAAYRPEHFLCLYQDRAKRGIDFRVNDGEAILKVDEDELHFWPEFDTVLMPRQFKRWTGAAIPKDVNQ